MSIDSQSEIKFPKINSYYYIGTAGQKAFGRGDTVDRAHLSEAAFYDDLERILSGLGEAAEYGTIDIETTTNGREHVFDVWQKAKLGRSPYTPIFIPWFMNAEYSANEMTEQEKNGLSSTVCAMLNATDEDIVADLQPDEKRLITRTAEEYNIILTPGQIKWRRYKIWDKGDLFFQEYPEDDVSCFLQTGRSMFNHIITDISKKLPLDNDRAMLELLGEEKMRAFAEVPLFAGVDGAEGIDGGDRHAFSVLYPDLQEGKMYVAYEYVSDEPIDVFWYKIKNVIMKPDGEPRYRILVGIEKQGIGAAHIIKARELGIRHKEWNTSGTTRTPMLTELEEKYRKEELIETYPDAEDEARAIVYNKNNRPEHPSGKHDDRIFSRAVALQMSKIAMPRITSI